MNWNDLVFIIENINDGTGDKMRHSVIRMDDLDKIDLVLPDKNSFKMFRVIDEINGGYCFVKRCESKDDFIKFIDGKYVNNNENLVFKLEYRFFNKDVERFLRNSLDRHYEILGVDDIKNGMSLKHTNGERYFIADILEKHDKKVDALVQKVSNGEIIYASGLSNYKISYPDDKSGKLEYTGIEWDSGRYFGPLDRNTNMQHIMLHLPVDFKVVDDIASFRANLLKEYVNTQDIVNDGFQADERLKVMALEVLADKFLGLDYNDFFKCLNNGDFDKLRSDIKAKDRKAEGRF